MANTRYVTMRLDMRVYNHLKVMAAREHRTLSNLVALILFNATEKDKQERKDEDI